MSRTLMSALQIQRRMIEAVSRDEAVIEAGIEVLVGAPTWRMPGPDGCNWQVVYTPMYAGHMEAIHAVIRDAQARFNLP